MRTVNRKKIIDREDVADAAIFAALGTIVLLSIEFLVTASTLHYITIPIFAIEGAVAGVAATMIALVAVRATDDED